MKADWREMLRGATDVALLGMAVTVAALPVVTAGAAVAAGSAAIHHFLVYGRWPDPRESWTVFRRALVPGLLASLGLGVVAALVTVDVLALLTGRVPGGPPLLAVTACVALIGLGFAGLAVVEIGARGGVGWRLAARRAAARPSLLPAAGGVVALAAVLAMLVHPLLVPLLAGYLLFALHVVAWRGVRRVA